MHYTKYDKLESAKVLMHCERGIDEPDNHSHRNESIDSSRTFLNYDLKNREGLTAQEYLDKRIEQIAKETKERTHKNIRKDAITLCSWVVTLPKDLEKDKCEDFFKNAYTWFSERYGEENIVAAAVHMDETTPHMHLQFTPIIEKDGVRKLCAKDMETRKTLQTAHRELQKYLEQVLECKVNILNGATEQGNKSVLQLKNEKLEENIAEKSEQYEKMTSILSDKELQEVDVTPKRLTGGYKGLSPKQAQDLVNTSTALSKENKRLKREKKSLEKEREEMEKTLADHKRKIEELEKAKTAYFTRDDFKAMQKKDREKEMIKRREKALCLLAGVPEGTSTERLEKMVRDDGLVHRKRTELE